MAISDAQKLDFLWKKIGYGVSKTDTNDNKKAPNESIASPLLLRGDKVWAQAGSIPAVIPTSSSTVVRIYPTSNPVETTADNTATANRTWKTGDTDWIPPEIGATYGVKVYVHTSSDAAGASGGTQLFATGSGNNDEWFFDYQSGVLHFIGENLPNGVDFTGKSIYISGARYIGTFGVSTGGGGGGGGTGDVSNTYLQLLVANTNSFISSVDAQRAADLANTNIRIDNLAGGGTGNNFNQTFFGNTSITKLILSNVLGTEFGGTGLSSFTQNGVAFASNTSSLSFATGTDGQIMQIAANGTPVFGILDGGAYS